MAPTPSPTIPTPSPGDNTAVIVGLIDPALIPAAPGDNGCPELCDTMHGTTADLANPPGSGWELTKIIAEIESHKGQPFSGATLDEILGDSTSAAPSVIAGVLLSLIVITAALIHHRRLAVTSPASTTAEEAN